MKETIKYILQWLGLLVGYVIGLFLLMGAMMK